MGYPTKYKPEYCEQVITHITEPDGTSLTSFAAEIGVSRQVINIWKNTHPDFFAACERAKAELTKWWESRAREVGKSGGGNGQSGMIALALKNFGADDWSEKSAIQITGNVTHSHEIDVSELTTIELQALQKVLPPPEKT